ncbi:hypothetical protein ABRP84_11025 [Corynebacterium sp. KPL2861]|jgi:hypothetical protein|uniref:hypothetical protein n=1 Tax=unclassified Corynebacterium TaxID=2624378 RepID=UPI0003B857FD|nr:MULTISPECIES: hypothetical protein [unclassified Corynebacterium]ERS57889.1 hypothetical protein HMPREF1281_00222 [Corynebacterium sp. KPL1855]ERS64774.1 hypothetical protein HMPREF1257_00223 [Corynebacterium sp. KPL1814]ERS80228.1 hypothetical protein HMPREF1285_00576 [Corynebacterium sp. KPL1859]
MVISVIVGCVATTAVFGFGWGLLQALGLPDGIGGMWDRAWGADDGAIGIAGGLGVLFSTVSVIAVLGWVTRRLWTAHDAWRP